MVRVVGAAILRDGRCLVAQRGPRSSMPLQWEFPGGKVEAGEDPAAALRREISEELGIEIEVGPLLGRGAAGSVVLEVFRARWSGGAIELHEHAAWRWIGAEDVDALAWAPADRPVLPALRAALEARAREPER